MKRWEHCFSIRAIPFSPGSCGQKKKSLKIIWTSQDHNWQGHYIMGFLFIPSPGHLAILTWPARLTSVLAIDLSERDKPFIEPWTSSSKYSLSFSIVCGIWVGVVAGRGVWRNSQTLIFNVLRRDQQGNPTTYECEVSHSGMAIEYPNVSVWFYLHDFPKTPGKITSTYASVYFSVRMKNNWLTRVLGNESLLVCTLLIGAI